MVAFGKENQKSILNMIGKQSVAFRPKATVLNASGRSSDLPWFSTPSHPIVPEKTDLQESKRGCSFQNQGQWIKC